MFEPCCCTWVRRNDPGGKPEIGVIGDCQSFVQSCDTDDACHRAEYLFTIDAHGVVGAHKERWGKVVAARGPLERAPACDQIGTFRLTNIDVFGSVGELELAGHWPQFHPGFERVANVQPPYALGQCLHKRIVDACSDDQPG